MIAFQTVNELYETWLRGECDVVEADLRFKHKRMRKTAFAFLRATFFRWAGGIEAVCPELRDAPAVLTVGDTHLENFGTWRDGQGRLVWGVNDFDEAAVIPYAFDLVRLAASVRLAPGLSVAHRAAAEAILRGYAAGLAKPRPTILDEDEAWMRPFVTLSKKDQAKFWREIEEYPPADSLPQTVACALRQSLPAGAEVQKFAPRRKGGGSLGRPRYVVIAAWRGGHLVREAKALVSSAWDWAHGAGNEPSRFMMLADGAHRSPDPFLTAQDAFLFRRIAPDARKVELGAGSRLTLRRKVLAAMGFDLGAIHASAAGQTQEIQSDLARRPSGWLHQAGKAAAGWVERDFRAWSHSG